MDLIAGGRFQAQAFITGHAHLYELNRVFEKLMKRSSEIKTAIVPEEADEHRDRRALAWTPSPCLHADETLTASLNQPGSDALSHAETQRSLRSRLGGAAAKLPHSRQTPTLEEARAWCQDLAETHYENFHVATWFLPKALRPHFHAIYAYCRVSDDLGDEVGDTAVALALLDLWGEELDACYAGRARHPVFVALAETIRGVRDSQGAFCRSARRVPPGPDRHPLRDHGRCAEYCRYSANPVGRLVLYACGEARRRRDENSASPTRPARRCSWRTSGRMCAWTLDARRVYLPQEDMEFFERHAKPTSPKALRRPDFADCCATEVDYARALFNEGLPLIGMVRPRAGARPRSLQPRRSRNSARHRAAGLRRAQRAPRDRKATKIGLAMRAAAAKLLPFLSLGQSRRARRAAD